MELQAISRGFTVWKKKVQTRMTVVAKVKAAEAMNLTVGGFVVVMVVIIFVMVILLLLPTPLSLSLLLLIITDVHSSIHLVQNIPD